MSAYYNELDPFAAAWLRNLISAKLIADGEVDERSIVDVRAEDLKGFTQCHFFAGIGGWSYALRLAGWPDDRPVWTGSCPCQPFSVAGSQKGFDDDRHLWPEFKRLIAKRQPSTVFGEQVASATAWLALVRCDLEALGYAVAAIPLEAACAGAFHLRDRFWFVADSQGVGSRARLCEGETVFDGPIVTNGSRTIDLADSDLNCKSDIEIQPGGQQRRLSIDPATYPCGDLQWLIGADGKYRPVKSGLRLLADGVPARLDQLRALGNAIDPRPAAQFIGAVMECLP